MSCTDTENWEANNTELLRYQGAHPVAPSMAYISVDLHTCPSGHSHYIVTAQTENVTDDLDSATAAAQATAQVYANAGYSIQRITDF